MCHLLFEKIILLTKLLHIKCVKFIFYIHKIIGFRTSQSKPTYKILPWHRHLLAGLLPWRLRFAPGSVHVGSVVETVLQFSPVNIIPLELHSHVSPGGMNNKPDGGHSSET
jgi:hypothetical protein